MLYIPNETQGLQGKHKRPVEEIAWCSLGQTRIGVVVFVLIFRSQLREEKVGKVHDVKGEEATSHGCSWWKIEPPVGLVVGGYTDLTDVVLVLFGPALLGLLHRMVDHIEPQRRHLAHPSAGIRHKHERMSTDHIRYSHFERMHREGPRVEHPHSRGRLQMSRHELLEDTFFERKEGKGSFNSIYLRGMRIRVRITKLVVSSMARSPPQGSALMSQAPHDEQGPSGDWSTGKCLMGSITVQADRHGDPDLDHSENKGNC